MNKLILKTERLSKRFGRSLAVNKVDLEVYEGDIYGFLGLNGAGKTTTIRLILRLIKPDGGEIWLYGKEIRRHYLKIMPSVGALVEIPVFYEYLSGRQNLKLLARLSNLVAEKQINDVLSWVGLTARADDKVRTYSQGMRQRLGIAQALLVQLPISRFHNTFPPFVILDEPTNGLDPQGIVDIRNLIKKLNQEYHITFFISSHLLSEMELLCNRVGIIKQGSLVSQGKVEDLLQWTSTIRVKLEPVDKAIELIKKLDWCKLSNVDKQKQEIMVKCPNTKSASLNAYLVQNNIQVTEITSRMYSLEDYFVSLM